MKNIALLSSIILLLFLASCTQKEQEQVVKIISDDSAMIKEEMNDEKMMKDETQEDLMMETEETMMDENNAMMEKDDAMMKESINEGITQEEYESMKNPIEQDILEEDKQGLYMSYSTSGLTETDKTVIFFHANWCPSCRAADKGILEGKIPENLTILKADFDTETELRKKYGVVAQHTFVQVDTNGNQVAKWLGGTSVEDITKNLK